MSRADDNNDGHHKSKSADGTSLTADRSTTAAWKLEETMGRIMQSYEPRARATTRTEAQVDTDIVKECKELPQVKEQGGVWTLSSSQDGKLMLKELTLKFRQGGLFGITDPDLNIDIAEHGAIPVLEHEAWERLSNETKFRHERRKITILLKLLGDYDSAEIVTKGKHINDRNPTKLVKKLQEQLANELMGRGENNRPIIFEEEVKPVLLERFKYTNKT